MQQNLTILKASAGSGKTFRLTQEYIDRLLAEGEDAYKRTLAVTFTNKATAEMKGRIVEALAREASADTQRGAAARARLEAILHDYGTFGVSTIDAWLQGLMRAFAHEAGQDPTYRVELDEDAVLEAVAGRILDASDADGDLRRRLRAMAMRNIEQGKTWNLIPAVKEMARQFLDERFLLQLRRSGSAVTDPAAVDALAADAERRIAAFESSLREAGERCLSALEADGRTADSFKGKSRGPMMVVTKWAAGEVKEPPAKMADTLQETDGLAVHAALEEALALFGDSWREYRTLNAVRDAVPAMALYARIFTEMDAYLKEQNADILRRCGDRLAGLVTEERMPHVEEKTGRRIDNVLIDEAQDTSALQWENLRPLVARALAGGGSALAVGDAKQAIYRWRGGDWRLLEGGFEDSLGGEASHSSLQENWRSDRSIVALNNRIFSQAHELFSGAAARRIASVYNDAMQTVPAARQEAAGDGRVRVGVIDDPDWHEEALRRCAEDIRSLHKEGYPWGGITILVRKNSEGEAAARHLAECGIPVISEDALRAGANPVTARIAASLALSYQDDGITRLCAEELKVGAASGDTLYDAVRNAAAQVHPATTDMPYVRVMQDAALDWQAAHGSDIPGFVEWWRTKGCYKSLSAGDGQDAVRVMTIHKAKGLSLDAVIVPFAAEPLSAASLLAPTMWCEARGSLAPLGLVPLRAHGTKLSGTQFEEDYAEEQVCQALDALNVMYVATTRARSRLILYMPKEESAEGAAPQTFAGLVQALLREDIDDDGIFEDGSDTGVKNIPTPGEECSRGGMKNVPTPGEKSSHNNKNNGIEKENKKETRAGADASVSDSELPSRNRISVVRRADEYFAAYCPTSQYASAADESE